MDLGTSYLGLRLPHPFMAGASPLVDDLDTVKRLEDAGSAAIVMHSLFEEQIDADSATREHLGQFENSMAEAQTFLPQPSAYALGPDQYLEQVRRIRAAVSIPVIGSLNGTTPGGWLRYAGMIEDAGAHALELNIYTIPTNAELGAAVLEDRVVEMLREVKSKLKIPVAVKLSPFYTSLPNFARRLDLAGADGLVLFNRFYQPDINVETLEVVRTLQLSDSSELLMRLHAMAILWKRVRASLAITGGVHTALDAVKALMSGAHAVQMVSAVLRFGPPVLAVVRDHVSDWLEEHEYTSIDQLRGSMGLSQCPDPAAYERGNYLQLLQRWPARAS